jgi:hypothetical protein
LAVHEPTYGAQKSTLAMTPKMPTDEELALAIGLLVGDGTFAVSKKTGRKNLQYKIMVRLSLCAGNRALLHSVKASFGGIGSSVYASRAFSEKLGYRVDVVVWAVSAQVHVLWLAKLVYSNELFRLSHRNSIRVIRMIECLEGGFDHYRFMEKLGFPESARLLSHPETNGVWPWALPKPLRFENEAEVLALKNFDDFLIGFVEAEGSFYPSGGAWYFNVSQADDKVLIDSIKVRFNIVGTVRSTDNSINYSNNF